MSAQRRLPSSGLQVLGVIVMPLVAGCGSGPTELSSPDIRLSPVAAMSLSVTSWQRENGSLKFSKAIDVPVRVQVDGGRRLTQVNGHAVPINLDATELAARRATLPAFMAAGHPRANGGGSAPVLVRPGLGGRQHTYRGTGGRPMRIEYSEARPGGKPPIAAAYFEDGRLRMMTETTFRRSGQSWEPIRIHAASFDALGRVSQVTTIEPRRGGAFAGGWDNGSAGNTGLLFSGFCRTVLSYIAPTPLFAAASATATVEDLEPPADLPESCRIAWLLYASAWAAAAAADLTAYVTCNACPVATPLCGPCLAAMASAAAFHLGLVAAAANLEECLSQQSGSSGSGGGGGGSGDCYEVYWWISYDDGVTWYLFEIEVVCPRGGPGET